MTEILGEIRARLRFGGPRQTPLHDEGVFCPAQVMPQGIRTAATVKRHLKAAGYAVPSPIRDGNWVLTEAGREWLTADAGRAALSKHREAANG